jgi:DNA-binding XRE family transcriptional regulator
VTFSLPVVKDFPIVIRLIVTKTPIWRRSQNEIHAVIGQSGQDVISIAYFNCPMRCGVGGTHGALILTNRLCNSDSCLCTSTSAPISSPCQVPRNETEQAFGTAVRKARLMAGLTQEDLAEKAGLHSTYISLLERGQRNPSLLVIERIAGALHLSMSELIAKVETQKKGR